MSLFEEVRHAFAQVRDRQEEVPGPIQVLRDSDDELAPGFNAMREHYHEAMLVLCRRGYRHYAGSTMPQQADEILTRTGEYMLEKVICLVMTAFSDGVLVGHQDDHLVKMCLHFNNPGHLFHDADFRDSSRAMCNGFAEDAEVLEFFNEYVIGGVNQMSHACGYAHQSEADPHKAWDIWLITGSACVSAGFLSGFLMGQSWKERDVLSGIEIASQEATSGPD